MLFTTYSIQIKTIFRVQRDADLFAKEKAYQLADRVSFAKGQEVDISMNATAKEALLSASTQISFFRQPITDEESKNAREERRKAKQQEANLCMPYQVPEPIKRSEKSLKEDPAVKNFVPLSDSKWYKKVQDSNQVYHPTDLTRDEPRGRRLRRQFVPDVAYVVPEKRYGSSARYTESKSAL